eukprot:SM000001S04554  [mRNA]  locus=s1:924531:928270:+ [translate_table: standard]
MGVHSLWQVLEPVRRRLPLSAIANQALCIDLSYWLLQLGSAVGNAGSHGKPHLRGLFHRLRALIGLNCRVILVADGDVPAIKQPEYQLRQKLGAANASRGRGGRAPGRPLHTQAASGSRTQHKRRAGSDFGRMVEEAKALAAALGIPTITSPEEGEAQCAALILSGICDACCTGDSDAFLFGATVVYRNISLSAMRGPSRSVADNCVDAYAMADVRKHLGLGREALIALGLLLGCDYHKGVQGVGPEKAMKIVQHIGCKAVLPCIRAHGVAAIAAMAKDKTKPPILDTSLGPLNVHGHSSDTVANEAILSALAIDAFLEPNCLAAGSSLLRRYAEEPGSSPDLAAITRFCEMHMEWPPEVTGNYLLTKIAERDLCRAAIAPEKGLRQPALQYTILAVIKARVVRLEPHFEVAWAGSPQLANRVIRSEAAMRAAPHKVEEFHALRKQKANVSKSSLRRKKAPVPAASQELEDLFSSLALEDGQSSLSHSW